MYCLNYLLFQDYNNHEFIHEIHLNFNAVESLEFVMAPFLLIFGSPSPMEFYPQRIVKQSTFAVIHLSRKLLIPQIFF